MLDPADLDVTLISFLVSSTSVFVVDPVGFFGQIFASKSSNNCSKKDYNPTRHILVLVFVIELGTSYVTRITKLFSQMKWPYQTSVLFTHGFPTGHKAYCVITIII